MSINITLSINNKEKSFQTDIKETLLSFKTKASQTLKFEISKYDFIFNGKVLINDKITIKELCGSNKELKIVATEKNKLNEIKQKPKSNDNSISINVKVENYISRNDLLSLIDDFLNSKGITKNDYTAQFKSQCMLFKFTKESLAIELFNYTNSLKSKSQVFNGLKTSVIFEGSVKKKYEYPIEPQDNINKSYNYQEFVSKREKIKKEKEEESTLEYPLSSTHIKAKQEVLNKSLNKSMMSNNSNSKKDIQTTKEITNTKAKTNQDSIDVKNKQSNKNNKEKSSEKKSDKNIEKNKIIESKVVENKSAIDQSINNISLSNKDNFLKKNIFSDLKTPSELNKNVGRKREFWIKNQQEKLNLINPVINRIGSPYLSSEEQYLMENQIKKEKWISKKEFKTSSVFIGRKLPVIPNYVAASPSIPPLLHKFREVDKKLWVGIKAFKLC